MLFLFMSQPDFACNPHAIYEYVKNNTEHETAWLIKKDERYYELAKRGIRCAVYNTMEGNELLHEANYVIMNSYTFRNLRKGENQIFANVWHGSGIKAHDFYEQDMTQQRVRFLAELFEQTDLMCVQSLDDRFKLSAMLHFDLRRCYVTGQARLDCVKSSKGTEKLANLFGSEITKYRRYIFFAPSFRANGSSHAGAIFSDNIFRLKDFDKKAFDDFLKENRAAFIYKLHPIEQTAFLGRKVSLTEDCFELTDKMLFEKDIRYDELLNTFDVMISDYSSIVYDFLLLNRPIIYLVPDYESYKAEKGFVFNNIDMFMPGQKTFCFRELLPALREAFQNPKKYKKERDFVLASRFDFQDTQSAKRCYETIVNYKKPLNNADEKNERHLSYPSAAQLLSKWLPKEYEVIDSSKEIPGQYSLANISRNPLQKYLYITEEQPRQLRKLTGSSSTEICDIKYYYAVQKYPNVKICNVSGGVDYAFFHKPCPLQEAATEGRRRRIGFAGTLDNRIYFAMMQCICEVFSDCDIVFTGDLPPESPDWMKGFKNIQYLSVPYEELPSAIQSLDIALLPFFGRHAETVPKEYFQYLACGKQTVASAMNNLPDSPALYRSVSINAAVENIKTALLHVDDTDIQASARSLAEQYDWRKKAKSIFD